MEKGLDPWTERGSVFSPKEEMQTGHRKVFITDIFLMDLQGTYRYLSKVGKSFIIITIQSIDSFPANVYKLVFIFPKLCAFYNFSLLHMSTALYFCYLTGLLPIWLLNPSALCPPVFWLQER